MRRRRITVDGRTVILRKSRCDINKDNAKAYAVLQLLSEIGTNEKIDSRARDRVKKYMAANNVSPSDLISLARVFPAKTTKNLIYSGVLVME